MDSYSDTVYSSGSSDGNNFNVSDKQYKLASSNPKKPAGRIKFQVTRHPVYRGIRTRNSGKWVCEVRKPKDNTRLWLGTHPTAEMAARAHDVAAIALRGRTACINFADSTWRLPVPASSADKDIQKAAAEAAEAFRPPQRVDNPDEKIVTLIMQEMMEMEDDEALSGLQGYMNYMAEGLMVLPLPRYVETDGDHVEPKAD